MSVHVLQVIFYVLAIVLLILAAVPPLAPARWSLALLGAASALFAYALPVLAVG